MSLFQAVDELHPVRHKLVNGYFITHYANKYVPIEIVKVCMLFCFVLDEFAEHIPRELEGANIEGINNTIIKTDDKLNCKVIFIGNNVIRPNSGKYYWKLKILQFSKIIKIGWVKSDVADNIHGTATRTRYVYHLKKTNWNPKFPEYRVYFDSDEMTVCVKRRKTKYLNNKVNKAINYRMAIQIFDKNTCIEMIEHNQSCWYKNDEIGFAKCEYKTELKLVHYAKAIEMNPNIELWHNEYLTYLYECNKCLDGYNHAIKYKKGKDGIRCFAIYFMSKHETSKALDLFKLLNQSYIDEAGINVHIGYCLGKIKKYKDAAKYLQLHLDQNINDEEWREKDKIYCLRQLGLSYYSFGDYQNGYKTFKQLTHQQIVQTKCIGQFAHCLHDIDEVQALKYYNLYLQDHPNNTWCYYKLKDLYTKKEDLQNIKQCLLKLIEIKDKDFYCYKDYGHFLETKEKNYNLAHKYYEKALEFATKDKHFASIYCHISINCYLLNENNLEDAIKYSLKALEYRANAGYLNANLAEWYFHSKQYDLSYKYFQIAFKYDPLSVYCNGYFAMLMFEWNRINEAIIYFEKYQFFKHKVRGDANIGFQSNCSRIYGMILYDKGYYDESIEICNQAILNQNDFIKYKKQDEIYYLLSRNYSKLMDFKTALQHLQTAAKLNPNRSIYTNQIKILTETITPDFDI